MRKKHPEDIQRIGYSNRHDPAVTLEKLFANEGGRTYAWVSYKDKRGQGYGSFHMVSKECLEGREYILNQSSLIPWSIHILFTDEVYEVGKRMRSLLVKAA